MKWTGFTFWFLIWNSMAKPSEGSDVSHFGVCRDFKLLDALWSITVKIIFLLVTKLCTFGANPKTTVLVSNHSTVQIIVVYSVVVQKANTDYCLEIYCLLKWRQKIEEYRKSSKDS